MVRYLHEYLFEWAPAAISPLYTYALYGGKVVPKTDEAWGAGLSTQCHLRIHSLVLSLSYRYMCTCIYPDYMYIYHCNLHIISI